MEDYFPPEISLLSNYIWYYLCLKVPVSFFKYYLLLQEAFPNWLHCRIFCFLSVLTHHWSYNEWFACSSPCLAVSFLRRKKKNKVWSFLCLLCWPHMPINGPFIYCLFPILVFHSSIFSTCSAICFSCKTDGLSLSPFLVSTVHLCPA